MRVNSAHHQAVRDPGPFAVVNAVAPDQVIEGVEDARYRFCLGVQWHPEFFIDPGDRRIFDALIAACARMSDPPGTRRAHRQVAGARRRRQPARRGEAGRRRPGAAEQRAGDASRHLRRPPATSWW